jgi:type 1 glutamine amidotransferase
MTAQRLFVGFRSVTLLLLAAWLACATSASAAGPGSPRKIVFIAGPLDSHPRETHEYEKNVILLKHCLDASPDFKGVTVEAYFNGWPTNPATLDNADTIFLTSGGSDRKETDHPLYVGDRFDQLARQMRRGCGLVLFHWSTFNPRRVHEQMTEWVGGYFDYESGNTPNKWFSAIQTREWTTAVATPEHPITRGVKPFKVTEEFYFNLRFRENDSRLRPILLKEPGGDTLANTVGWAVERADGGRGFGFTGGHFYKNWWLPDFRRLVLNAVAWTARLEVPSGGVRSDPGERFRALIVTGHNHPAHDWRTTTGALLHVLEQDPRALVEVTENPEDLASPRLNDYPLLVLNYCNWQRPGLSDAAKTNLTRYLSNGGGVAVIHFANGAFHSSLPGAETSDWPEYRRIVRRVWDHQGGSGHDAFGRFRVDITGAAHPITRGLAAFETVDELYFKQAGQEPIEPLATARSQVTGRDEPMAWAYGYGRGRVFQTVLGHANPSIFNAAPLIRRGAAWSAVREPLSFDPPPELVERAAFRAGSPWTSEKPKSNE